MDNPVLETPHPSDHCYRPVVEMAEVMEVVAEVVEEAGRILTLVDIMEGMGPMEVEVEAVEVAVHTQTMAMNTIVEVMVGPGEPMAEEEVEVEVEA